MFVAFQRTTGSAALSMLSSESWDDLKSAMCHTWQVEHDFDRFGCWASLSRGEVVALGSDLFRLVDTDRTPGLHDLFGAPRYEVMKYEPIKEEPCNAAPPSPSSDTPLPSSSATSAG